MVNARVAAYWAIEKARIVYAQKKKFWIVNSMFLKGWSYQPVIGTSHSPRFLAMAAF